MCSITRDATSSCAAPTAANARAGPFSSTGAKTMPKPPPLAAADPVNTNGSSSRTSFHPGTAVCDRSTAVYEATPGAMAAADSPSGRASRFSRRAGQVCRHRRGTSSFTAAAPTPGPNAVRIHVPTLIGDVGLTTRSMWWNRSGRPRSLTRNHRLASSPANEPSQLTRRSAGRPVRSAPAATTAVPAARPPVNR